jgi:2-methylcitrate dehydratase PrpD
LDRHVQARAGLPLSDAAATRLAAFAAGLRLPDVPGDVRHAARLHLLDALGCGLAAHGLGEAQYGRRLARGATAGPASAIGVPDGIDAATAALANGIAIHALDFDDTHGASISHVSAVVVPAALAAAEARPGTTAGHLLTALIAGNEVTCRVGLPAGDAFHLRGFHPTAICGVFGATAAVGVVENLDAATLTQAFGIAGSMAGGLLAYLTDGSSTKRIHPGWMAHAAHLAVRLAQCGATGPSTVLEGPAGVYQAFLGRDDLDVPTDDLGTRWDTPDIAFKPYPCCHFMHAALDAADGIRTRLDLLPDDVAGITVLAPQAAIDMVLAPLERKHRPQTPYEGKFSTPFALGALFVHGTVDVQTFTEPMLHDDAVLAVAARVDAALHGFPTFPESFAGGVRIRLNDGSEHEALVPHQRGGTHAPISDADVRGKFLANARTALNDLDAGALEAFVMTADGDDDLAGVDVLRRAAPRHGAP